MSDKRRSSSRKCVKKQNQIPSSDKSRKSTNQTLSDTTVR
jgi:hypothetical protein